MVTCDLCGGDAKSYGPRGRRCLACLAADDPALRSDVPALGECDWGPLCVHLASVRRLRIRLALLEIARAEAARERDETAAEAFGAGETHAAAVVAEWVERCTKAARILETFGDIGGTAALAALRGGTR